MSGGGLFGGWLDPVGRAFMNEISALTKETPDSSHTSSTMWGHCVEMVIYESGSRILPDIASASALILNFQPPEPWEINLCCLWAIHSMTFCYSSLKELRHWARCSIFLSLVPDLENKMKIPVLLCYCEDERGYYMQNDLHRGDIQWRLFPLLYYLIVRSHRTVVPFKIPPL